MAVKPIQRAEQRRRGSRSKAALAAFTVAALALWAAPSASALGLTGLTASPTDTQAGAHSDFHVHVGFSTPADQVKDVTIGLPPGLIGDPTATPQCTVAQLNTNTCPANTAVGDVSTGASVLGIPLPAVTGTLYNLVPQAGEPARFGIVLVPPLGGILLQNITLQSAVQLRKSDLGLDTVINNIPNTVNTTLGLGVQISITSMDVTLHGSAGSPPKPFMRNPTYCSTATTNFAADSYATPGTFATGQASFTPTGCANEPFDPQFSAQIGALTPGAFSTKAPVTTAIEQASNEAGLKKALVILPSGLSPDLNVLNSVCQPSDFAAGACPASSIVGQATATSPILTQPLTGPVALIANAGLPNVGLDLHGQLAIQLQGSFVTGAGGSGVQFDGLPDIPIARFQLSFAGGPAGLLAANRSLCQPPGPLFQHSFDSYSGATRSGSTLASIDCGAAAKARASIRLRKSHSTHPSLRLKATAGPAPLRSVKLKLPKQLGLAAGKRGILGTADLSPLPRSKIRHGKRILRAAAPSGAGALALAAGSGALEGLGPVGKRLSFRVTLIDVNGRKTSLKLKVRAR